MKFLQCLTFIFGIIIIPACVFGQSDNLDIHTKESALLERLDILLKNDSILGFTSIKPFNRAIFTARIEFIDSLDKAGALPVPLSSIDRYDIRSFLMDNSEWTRYHRDSFLVTKPVLHHFYETPAHLFAVNDRIFKMRLDPVLDLQYGKANDGTGTIYNNTRGLLLRGTIDKKIGFYSYLSDNQEKAPSFVRQWVQENNAVPGVGYYKNYRINGYDYWGFRGGISFNVAKYIHLQFAYDKLFIGDGYRSLFLSDFANNFLFMRLSTRLWKFNYEMIIAETMQSVPQVGREIKPKNYMSIHYLSAQITPWLHMGIYENIMENGSNGVQLSYLNPVIFYRATETNLGGSGKANIGIDLKANLCKSVQLYGQLLINEFQVKEVLHYGNGSYVNKQALQAGIKYINALGIKNLDLQVECNLIRPFTYTNFDSTTNLTHYNQPLAHPLGANAREFILLARYRPVPRLYLSGKMLTYLHGLDSLGSNMGGNIFRSYVTRLRDYSWYIGSGIPVNSTTLGLNISYEVWENSFLEWNAAYRTYEVGGQVPSSVFYYSIGFRMNIQRREFNF